MIEEKLKQEIKKKYKKTYANIIYHLMNKINFLEEQNQDLNKIINEKKLKIKTLKNELEERRKE